MVEQTPFAQEAKIIVEKVEHERGIVGWEKECLKQDPSSFCVRHRFKRQEVWWVDGEISRGSFGRVTKEYLTNRKLPPRGKVGFRAVKVFERRENSKSLDFNRELNAIFKFSQQEYQPYFVKAYAWWFMPESINNVCIAMEYIEQGNLKQLLGELDRNDIPKGGLGEDVARDITQQLLKGLLFMHDNGYAHRDLKPANILVESLPPCPWVKIADFGISKHIGDNALDSTTRWTWGYQSPEIDGFVNPKKNEDGTVDDRPRDIWAVGEICFQLLTKESTFPSLKEKVDHFQNVMALDAKSPTLDNEEILSSAVEFPSLDKISESARSFVSEAMQVHPRARITAKKGLKNEWVETHIQDMKYVFGLPLSELMTYAATTGKLVVNAEGSFELLVGSCTALLPILFAECGQFLIREVRTRRSGCSSPDAVPYKLAQDSRSDERITKLKKAFDCSPRFGRSHDWDNTTTIRDILELLRDFINELKEPLIDDQKQTTIIRNAHLQMVITFGNTMPRHNVRIIKYCLCLIHYLSVEHHSVRTGHQEPLGSKEYDKELMDMFGSMLLPHAWEILQDKEAKHDMLKAAMQRVGDIDI